MSITASLVKDLREKTGAGMMDCKKALTQTEGDLEKAVDWLREKGLAAAAKKESRVASEGLVGVAVNGNQGAIVELNAETDFVSRNEIFQSLLNDIVQQALKTHVLDELNQAPYPNTDKTVSEQITHTIASIGENMTLRRSDGLKVDQGIVAPYIHNAATDGMGRIGVLVALESQADQDALLALGRQLAMHIAASQPLSTFIEDLDPQVVEREKAVLQAQARQSGKPDDIIEKMMVGRMRKFYEQVVLNEQTFVMDGETPIKKVLENESKKLGHPIKLVGFICYRLGEGVEVEKKDFAQEVAEQLKN